MNAAYISICFLIVSALKMILPILTSNLQKVVLIAFSRYFFNENFKKNSYRFMVTKDQGTRQWLYIC